MFGTLSPEPSWALAATVLGRAQAEWGFQASRGTEGGRGRVKDASDVTAALWGWVQ